MRTHSLSLRAVALSISWPVENHSVAVDENENDGRALFADFRFNLISEAAPRLAQKGPTLKIPIVEELIQKI